MQVIKNSIIYLGSSILNKLIPFLLLPIMTKYLSPDAYGRLSIYMILIGLYGAFIGMNLHANISKNFFSTSKKEIALYIGNILFILLISFCFYMFLNVIYVDKLYQWVGIDPFWLLFIPFISLMSMVNSLNATILRNEGRAYVFGLYEVGNTLMNIIITVILLVLLQYGWISHILGMIIAYTLFAIIGLGYMYRKDYLYLQIDLEKIKSILAISLPLIPHVLGGIIIALSDRIFIEHMIGLDEVGIYSVGYMFGMILKLFSDAVIKAWSPWFYREMSYPDRYTKERIVKYMYLYMVGIICLALVIAYIGEWILPYFVDEKYYNASQYIFWVTMGYAMFGMYQIFFPYLVYCSKTSFLAFSTTGVMILNLILNYFFINYFGAIGATYATFASYLIMFLSIIIYVQKIYPMPWSTIYKRRKNG